MLIPVYRINENAYYTKRQEYINSNTETANNSNRRSHRESYLCESYGGSWEFNEIIGYIKLYFDGSQILGEYWAVNARRIVKTRKKQYEYKTHKLSPELTIKNKTGDTILKTVKQYIENCKNELKNRHLDTHEFETLSPYIDWKSLYNNKNQY